MLHHGTVTGLVVRCRKLCLSTSKTVQSRSLPIRQELSYRTSRLTYIDANPAVFTARLHDQNVLEHPPKLAQHFIILINILIERRDQISNELNHHILTSSPPLHWAAEVYHYVLPAVRIWLESGKTPQNLDAILSTKLSFSLGVYFCKPYEDFYTGSGTSTGASSSDQGCLKRQNDRNLSQNNKKAQANTLAKPIKDAVNAGKPIQWAQAFEILVPRIIDGVLQMVLVTELDDVQELLRFRTLTILAEVLLTMSTAGHKADY